MKPEQTAIKRVLKSWRAERVFTEGALGEIESALGVADDVMADDGGEDAADIAAVAEAPAGPADPPAVAELPAPPPAPLPAMECVTDRSTCCVHAHAVQRWWHPCVLS